MSAPKVTKPVDVPDLRLWLIEQWRPGRPFDRTAEIANRSTLYQSETTGEWLSATMPGWDLEVMQRATLWWVSREMCDVLEAAAHQLPDDIVLTWDSVPDPYGFVVFERSLNGTDAVTGEPLFVDAVAWGPSPPVRPNNRTGVASQAYRKLSLGMGLDETDMRLLHQSGAIGTVVDYMQQGRRTEIVFSGDNDMELWSWLGRTDWIVGDKASDYIVPELDIARHKSMIEDRKLLAALWYLSTQPNLAGIEEAEPPRPTRRRSERERVESKVRIVNLRKPKIDRDTPVEHRHIEWSKRWLVGGHWRHQPYGPERSYRKWVWIAPYVKGPEDKPLVIRETVKVVK